MLLVILIVPFDLTRIVIMIHDPIGSTTHNRSENDDTREQLHQRQREGSGSLAFAPLFLEVLLDLLAP